jgi:hypothetical protein
MQAEKFSKTGEDRKPQSIKNRNTDRSSTE